MKSRILLTMVMISALVLPALAQGIDGKWSATQTTGRGEVVTTFEFKNAAGTVTGTMARGQGTAMEIKNGKFADGKLTFEASQGGRGGEPVVITYTGVLSGDSIKFTTAGGRGPQEIEAKRVK